MKTARIHIFFGAALALFAAASSDIPEEPMRLPVIEGWIDSDGYPVVMFTSSLPPSTEGGNVAEMMIRWGKVVVSDGCDSVILTGGPNSGYFPPFRYYSFDMKGVPGRTYTVDVEFDNLHARAECRMPEPTTIDSIVFRGADSDTLRTGTLYFTAPADCPAYYNLEIKEYGRRRRAYPAMLGAISTTVPGAKVEVPVFRPKNELDTGLFVPQFAVGDEIEVSLCRVEKPVYDFWSAYDNDVVFGHSVFLGTSAPLPTNVQGGLGVWSARGVDKRAVTVR
ncbi:MAG: DUF4249 domain-containing protein [Firmicutes bacterium]|nr:DUF4249 domain-containing protein [Bacillota bacterium]MCM1401095.1 DUF4249 domain-containing protein [Bacteroides sp.]MCM1477014.1 DUF4249 domain-containing protein [Bacteroides sp.]